MSTPQLRNTVAWLRWLFYPAALLLLLALLFTRGGMQAAEALATLGRVNIALLGLAVALQALRFLGMGLVFRAVGRTLGLAVPLGSAMRLSIAGVAARALVPLGGVADYTLRSRFLGQRGAQHGTIAAYFILDSAIYWLALMVIFTSGFIAYLLFYRALPPQPLIFSSAALLTLLALLALLLLRRDQRRAAWLARRVVSALNQTIGRLLGRTLLPGERVEAFVEQLHQGLQVTRRQRYGLARLSAIGLLHHLADAATLLCVFAALGEPIRPVALLLGYGLSIYVAFLTPLPADLGVVEASLALVFTTLAYDMYAVVIGVLLFRLISLWLPALLGVLVGVQLVSQATGASGQRSEVRG